MSGPLVSVIMPTFNRVYCLSTALDSALAQTYHNVEIVLLDDGSTDETRRLVEERYADEPRVRYIYQENAGVSAARNHALELARGEYIAFLDSDDCWEPWKIELQLACMESDPKLVMVWTDMQARNPQGEVADPHFLRQMYSAYHWFTDETLFSGVTLLCEIAPALAALVGDAVLRTGELYSAMLMGNLVHTSTVLLKRSIANRVGKFNPEYKSGEDYDYHLRTCKLGPVGFLDISTIQYQIGMPDRLTRSELSLHTACNFLKVLSRELETETERITLPKRMKRAVLADAHRWIGYEILAYNDTKRARCHFLESMRYAPWHKDTLRLLAISCLPASTFEMVRRWFRRVRGIQPPVHANSQQPPVTT